MLIWLEGHDIDIACLQLEAEFRKLFCLLTCEIPNNGIKFSHFLELAVRLVLPPEFV